MVRFTEKKSCRVKTLNEAENTEELQLLWHYGGNFLIYTERQRFRAQNLCKVTQMSVDALIEHN